MNSWAASSRRRESVSQAMDSKGIGGVASNCVRRVLVENCGAVGRVDSDGGAMGVPALPAVRATAADNVRLRTL